MQRVNVLLPVGLWPALAKAAVNLGHQRASFVRMVLQQACRNGLPAGAKPIETQQSAAPVVPVKRAQREARPIVMTLEQAQELLLDEYRLRNADRLYAARICVGDSEEEALAFMRREYDPQSVDDPYEPPVTQASWSEVRALSKNGVPDDAGPPFDAEQAQKAYDEYIADGWPPEKAEEVIRHVCASSGVTDWNPPNVGGEKLQ